MMKGEEREREKEKRVRNTQLFREERNNSQRACTSQNEFA
jgi:hypothetical protein